MWLSRLPQGWDSVLGVQASGSLITSRPEISRSEGPGNWTTRGHVEGEELRGRRYRMTPSLCSNRWQAGTDNTIMDQEKWYYPFNTIGKQVILNVLVPLWNMKYTRRGKHHFKAFLSHCWETSSPPKMSLAETVQGRQGWSALAWGSTTDHGCLSPLSSNSSSLSSWCPQGPCGSAPGDWTSSKRWPANVPLPLATVGVPIPANLSSPTREEDRFLQDLAKPRPPRSDLFPLAE